MTQTPLPANIDPCVVRGRYTEIVQTEEGPVEVALTGSIVFKPSVRQLVHASTQTVVSVGPVSVELDESGEFEVELVPTDDADLTPQDWGYTVIPRFNRKIARFGMAAPAGEIVEITEATPIIPGAGNPIAVGPKGDKGDPGEPTTWAGLTDKPTTFPPAPHVHAELVDAIAAEQDARTAADEGLDERLIVLEGAPAIPDLTTELADEAAARGAADTVLEGRIVDLETAPPPDWDDVTGKPVEFTPATHTHPITQVVDLAEYIRDIVGATLVGNGITVTVDDAGDTITLTGISAADPEQVRDIIGVALIGTGLLTVTVNDAGDTILLSTSATQNSTDAALRDRSTHTGTQSLDTTTDSATRLAMTAAERTKLAGVQTGATQNDTDANLKNRGNHTGQAPATSISDLTETVQDIVGALISNGNSGISVAYNDGAGTLTISLASHAHVSADVSDLAEYIRDTVAAFIVQGTNVTVTHNDPGDTLTIASTGGGGSSLPDQVYNANAPTPVSFNQSVAYGGAGYGAAAAFDADPNTYTHSDSTLPYWVSWEYATAQELSSIFIVGRLGWTARVPADFKVQSSPDGTTWTDVKAFTGLSGWTDAGRTFALPDSTARKFWRIYVTAGAGDVWQHFSTITAKTRALLEEFVRDTIVGMLVQGSNITLTPDDANNTLTIAAASGGGGGGGGGTALSTTGKLLRAVPSSLAVSGVTTLPWSAPSTDGMGWTRAASNTQWVCPADGNYDISMMVRMSGVTASRSFAQISTTRTGTSLFTAREVFTGDDTALVTLPGLAMKAGDTFEAIVYVNGGGSATLAEVALEISQRVVTAAAAAFVGCKATRTATQALGANDYTAAGFIGFTAADSWDTDSIHDPAGANPSRFVVPVGMGGKWRFAVTARFGPNSSGFRQLAFYVNGVEQAGQGQGSIVFPVGAGLPTIMESEVTLDLNAGDYVQVHAATSSAVDLTYATMTASLVAGYLASNEYVGVRANRTTIQNIPFNTQNLSAALSMTDADSWDTHGMHDPTTNPTRITIPAGKGGKWQFTCHINWDAYNGGLRQIVPAKNGVGNFSDPNMISLQSTQYPTNLDLTVVYDLVPGDYIEFVPVQNGGSPNLGCTGWVEAHMISAPAAQATQAQTIVAKTASYAIVETDVNKLLEFNSASGVTLTLPADTTDFPVGGRVDVLVTGAGMVTVAGAGGVTVNGTPSLVSRAQWSALSVIKRAANTWVVVGDLA